MMVASGDSLGVLLKMGESFEKAIIAQSKFKWKRRTTGSKLGGPEKSSDCLQVTLLMVELDLNPS